MYKNCVQRDQRKTEQSKLEENRQEHQKAGITPSRSFISENWYERRSEDKSKGAHWWRDCDWWQSKGVCRRFLSEKLWTSLPAAVHGKCRGSREQWQYIHFWQGGDRYWRKPAISTSLFWKNARWRNLIWFLYWLIIIYYQQSSVVMILSCLFHWVRSRTEFLEWKNHILRELHLLFSGVRVLNLHDPIPVNVSKVRESSSYLYWFLTAGTVQGLWAFLAYFIRKCEVTERGELLLNICVIYILHRARVKESYQILTMEIPTTSNVAIYMNQEQASCPCWMNFEQLACKLLI